MDAMLLLKATVVVSIALSVAYAARHAAAATRHRLWTVAFVSLLALPPLALTLPALRVPVPASWITSAASRIAQLQLSPTETSNRYRDPVHTSVGPRPAAPLIDAGLPEPAGSPRAPAISATSMLFIVWLVGTAAAIGGLITALVRARQFARRATTLDDDVWRAAATRIGVRLGLRCEPRLLVSRDVASPMAGGLWRPMVLLPASIGAWSAERRDIVLAHELAHLAGRDSLRHLLARAAVALYWFHPFVWIAAWQASVAREQACDEAVIALGTRPSLYARVLLDLAESIDSPVANVAALSMVDRSLLETRLMTILNKDGNHLENRRITVPAIALAALTLPLAAAQPALTLNTPTVVRDTAAPVATQVALHAAPVPAAQTIDRSDFTCRWSGLGSSVSIDGSERVIHQTIGDVRLCMVADVGDRSAVDRPSEWLERARHVVIETQHAAGGVHRLEVVRELGGGQRVSWRVAGTARPFDASAERWRDSVIAVLDTTWELGSLRGHVSSLQGQISSIRGQESSLRGEISSLRGEVSAMQGSASSIRGEESALRGEIASIRGHISALRGEISAARGAISAVDASRYGANSAERAQIDARVKRHEAEIARVEQAIRDYNAEAKIAALEKDIVALASGRASAIEAQIRAFDLPGRVAAVERRIAELDVAGKVSTIERQIEALDADRRTRQLQERREQEVKELDAAIRAIR